MLACLDGRVLPAEEAMIPVTDEGLLRGDGVFEVARVYPGGLAYALDEHIERMRRSAELLRLPFDPDDLAADAERLLERTGDDEGYLRMVVTRGGRRIVLLEPVREAPATIALATVHYEPTRVLDQIKSLSYAANMLVTRLAREQGADEALLVTPRGRVLEGPRQAFVASLDGEQLVTPPLGDRVLDSITRRRLLESGLVAERAISVDELPYAHEAFLASTTQEAHPVHAIDGVALPPAPGPLTLRARAAVLEAIGAALGRPLAG
ncbi:MAG TPA: aminotransferase class IV [Solirubrobacteraceae bacterium]|nr:aminotransferase class IV [Solirubrobacteraceae bacterium]